MTPGKIKKLILLPVFWLVNLCFAIPMALAEGTAPASTGSFNVNVYLTTKGQEKSPTDIGQYILRLVNFLTLMIGSFAFLAIVIGGIMLLTSAGKEQQVTKGKDIIKYAITGLVVALASYFITAFVQSIFYEYGAAT